MSTKRSYLVALTASSTHHAWIEAASEDAAIAEAERLWQEDDSAFSYKDGCVESTTVLESQETPLLNGASLPTGTTPEITREISLERAVAVIAQAELALADLDAARRKGYLAEASTMVFAFMDDWRAVQQHVAAIVTGKVQP